MEMSCTGAINWGDDGDTHGYVWGISPEGERKLVLATIEEYRKHLQQQCNKRIAATRRRVLLYEEERGRRLPQQTQACGEDFSCDRKQRTCFGDY